MLNQLQKTLKFYDFSYFFPYRETLPEKCSQNDLPGHSGTLPGSLREGEIDHLFAPGGPQGANNEFLGTPGPPQSPSRRAPGSLWKQSRRPRVAQRPPGSHFGAILPPFSTLRGIIFQGFWPHFPLFSCFPHRLFSSALCSVLRLLCAAGSAPSARWPVLGRQPL